MKYVVAGFLLILFACTEPTSSKQINENTDSLNASDTFPHWEEAGLMDSTYDREAFYAKSGDDPLIALARQNKMLLALSNEGHIFRKRYLQSWEKVSLDGMRFYAWYVDTPWVYLGQTTGTGRDRYFKGTGFYRWNPSSDELEKLEQPINQQRRIRKIGRLDSLLFIYSPLDSGSMMSIRSWNINTQEWKDQSVGCQGKLKMSTSSAT